MSNSKARVPDGTATTPNQNQYEVLQTPEKLLELVEEMKDVLRNNKQLVRSNSPGAKLPSSLPPMVANNDQEEKLL